MYQPKKFYRDRYSHPFPVLFVLDENKNIKEGDDFWLWDEINKTAFKADEDAIDFINEDRSFFKIIASSHPLDERMPKIPKKFIEYFNQEYSKKKLIFEVQVHFMKIPDSPGELLFIDNNNEIDILIF